MRKRWLTMLSLGLAVTAHAQTAPKPADPIGHPVRVGVITDMAGSLAALAGPGAVLAVQMAAEDCLVAECAGMNIEVLTADHQNKPDVAVGIVRDWFDNKGVTAVADIIQASVQVAVQHEAASHNKIALFSGGTSRLTNEDCAPATSVMWMWDTYGQAEGITKPLAKPGSKWFLIVPDYVFGASLQADATDMIKADGGEVVGSVRHPFNFPGDFSSFLLQGQGSPASVVAIGSTGADLISILKQAREFGVGADGKQTLASFVLTNAGRRRARPGGGAGRADQRGVLLEPRRGDARLVGEVLCPQRPQDADHHPGGGLRRGAGVSRRRRRRQIYGHGDGDGKAARDARPGSPGA